MHKVEYICTEEIRAIDKLLSTKGDPVELARSLGIARLSQFARERLMEAYSFLPIRCWGINM